VQLLSKKTIAKKLSEDRKFRDSYVLEHVKRSIPFQVRAMRDERGWSQARAGEALGKPQNVISRYESPAYGKLNLQTLLEIASGFGVGLLIKFVPLSRFVREYDDVSPAALSAKSVAEKEEIAALNAWANVPVPAEESTSEVEITDYWQPIIAEALSTESYTWNFPLAQDKSVAQGAKVFQFPASSEAPQDAIQATAATQDYLPGILYPKLREASDPTRIRRRQANQSAIPALTPDGASSGVPMEYEILEKQLANANKMRRQHGSEYNNRIRA
jgi:transcriptional regulator with XRE-family HTH domain